jgi:predicted NAD/FAD-binding protein
MRIAVIGSGIAGMGSAWLLSRKHEVTLFEANARLGGHTHTHIVEQDGRNYSIDSGFIVFNPDNYPLFTQLLEQLGVASQPTTMSFAVHNEASGLEYNASSLDALFCQRRNLFSPYFIRMVHDILRFYRNAPKLLDQKDPGPTLQEWLQEHRYGKAFRDEHLIPMASALWSSPAREILRFPMQYLVRFMTNHRMLQVQDRPQWRVVKGGSQRYVDALRAQWSVYERPACPVQRLRRHTRGVTIESVAGAEEFDQVVLACHSDQALALLADADDRERSILGAIRYQNNNAVLHTDARLLPRNRKAWAAWNVLLPRQAEQSCTVTYCMNLLQSLDSAEPFCVSLNSSHRIDPTRVLRRMRYEHPVYDHASVLARARKGAIQGQRNTWYAGAYWGFGFHEDGLLSATEVAHALDIHWPLHAMPAAAQQTEYGQFDEHAAQGVCTP